MLLLFSCLVVEFIRTSPGHGFHSKQWLFTLYPAEPPPGALTVVAIYSTTVRCVGLTLKVWNSTARAFFRRKPILIASADHRGWLRPPPPALQ